MAKSVKREKTRKNIKQGKKQSKKQNTRHKYKMKKSTKKSRPSRKNIKRVSLKNFFKAHKRHVSHHHHKAKHNSNMTLHGGKKYKGGSMCACGCGRKCGLGCGCGPYCGCDCGNPIQTRRRGRSIGRSRGRYIGGKYMKGGMVSSPASGPVGYAWNGGDESSWPGVTTNPEGITMSNHFAVSPNGIAVGGVDLARSTSDDHIINPPMNGGRKNRRHGKVQKGGFFQEIVNLGRGVQDEVNGGYFNLIGKQQPLSQNPWPTEQPIATTGASGNVTPSTCRNYYPNIEKIVDNANTNVAGV